MLTGRLQPRQSLTQIRSLNALYRNQRVFLCHKSLDGKKITRRLATIIETNGKTKNCRRFVRVKLNKSNKIVKIMLDMYAVDDYPSCRWEQLRWIEI